jgi:large subunit ribosomal protein L21
MYAVIKAGGKQQKVKAGDVIEIELMRPSDGNEVTFTPILVVDDDGKTHFGKDLGKAVVRAKLLGEQKGEKVKVFKYRQKTGYSRKQGHRQTYTLVEIEDVSLGKRMATKAGAAGRRPTEPAEPTSAEPGEPAESADPAVSAPRDDSGA